MANQLAVVANTDQRWFEYLSSVARKGGLDEVNFWRPLAQAEFKAIEAGQPLYLRLKHPINAIAGYGYFAHATRSGEVGCLSVSGSTTRWPPFSLFPPALVD